MTAKRAPKVLMAIPHADVSIAGGSSVQMYQTMHYCRRHGIEPDIFHPGKSYSRDSVDLVHLFGANPAMYDLAMRLQDLGIPYVVSTIFFTMHRPGFLQSAVAMEKLSKKIFGGIWTDYGVIAAICAGARMILPNTSAEAELLSSGLGVPEHKISIIPNGVENRFDGADGEICREKYGVEDFILYVGNLGSKRKNALSLIRALSGIDCPSLLIGRIFDNSYGRQCLSEASQNPQVTLTGHIQHNDPLLASAYAASRLFVLPAYFETPGIAALEAALCNTPVVITQNGGTKDYFADDAVYVNPKSVNDIREGIRRGLTLPGGSRKLKERILDTFLWEHTGAKTAEIYKTVLAKIETAS